MNKFRLLLAIMIMMLAMTACSPRALMVREFVDLVEEGLPAFEQEDDLNLLAHAMPAHIKLLETLLAAEPQNKKLLVLLARLYGGYAFAVLETELEAQRLEKPSVVQSGLTRSSLESAVVRYYRTGAKYALRSLQSRYPQAVEKLNQVATAESFIQTLDNADVPALFWYGFNMGGFVRHRLDSVEALAKAYLVEKSMSRVVDIQETYDDGNAHLALMVYHASRSPMMGGSPDKARNHFQRHAHLNAGATPLGHFYRSRYILVQQDDKAAFVQGLSAILNDPDSDARMSLLDRVAVVRARLYLESVERFFE